jgi:hypothetical protein
LGLLGQVTDANIGLWPCFAVEFCLNARHDPEQCALPGAVQAEYPDLGARKKTQRNISQDKPLRWHQFGDSIHDKNVLGHSTNLVKQDAGLSGNHPDLASYNRLFFGN